MIGNDEFMAENRGIFARFSSARHFFCDKAERKKERRKKLTRAQAFNAIWFVTRLLPLWVGLGRLGTIKPGFWAENVVLNKFWLQRFENLARSRNVLPYFFTKTRQWWLKMNLKKKHSSGPKTLREFWDCFEGMYTYLAGGRIVAYSPKI